MVALGRLSGRKANYAAPRPRSELRGLPTRQAGAAGASWGWAHPLTLERTGGDATPPRLGQRACRPAPAGPAPCRPRATPASVG